MFPGPLGESLAGKALKEGVWSLEAVDIRRFAKDRHGTVDDAPFRGRCRNGVEADILSRRSKQSPAWMSKLLMSPRGARRSVRRAGGSWRRGRVCCWCAEGFEGVDERVIEAHALEEVSVGDFVLSGGEIAAMAVMDCLCEAAARRDGRGRIGERGEFRGRTTGVPHYTRPATWAGPDGTERRVPEVLVSGHHGRVAEWRRQQREEITRRRRPDLWDRRRTAKTKRRSVMKGRLR